jgi:hypothetical protein
MASIFISYAHEDQAAAKRIVDALAREGLDAWWDHEIPPGRSWDEVIASRIGAAKVTIVIWSRRSIGSDFVKEEAQIALEAGKLVPVRVDDIEPPIGFRRTHAANLIGWRGESGHPQWRLVLEEVRGRLGGAAPAKPIRRQSSYRGGGGGGFLSGVAAALVIALVLGGGWYAYNQGWLAPPRAAAPVEQTAAEVEPPGDSPARDDERVTPATQEADQAARPRSPAPREISDDAPQITPANSVGGTTWRGQIRYPNGPVPLAFRFNADGSVDTQMDRDSALRRTTDTWSQSGNVVSVQSRAGVTRLSISDGVMGGTASGGLITLTREDGASASPTSPPASIVGTWRGQVNSPRVFAAGFRFYSDGSAEVLTMPNGRWTGNRNYWRWIQNGDTITLTSYANAQRLAGPGAVLTGRLSATTWSGTYVHDGQSHSFQYTRQ